MRNPSAWADVTAEQIGFLNPSNCFELQPAATNGMSPAAIAGFTGNCTEEWSGSGNEFGQTLCTYLDGPKFAMLTPDAVSGLTSPCADSLSPAAFSQASSQQLAVLRPMFCMGLGASVLHRASPSALAGMGSACLQNLQESACAGFTPDGLSAIQPDNFVGEYAQCRPPTTLFMSIGGEGFGFHLI